MSLYVTCILSVADLVPTEDDVWSLRVGVSGELVQPVPGGHQALVAGHVEHQDEAHGVPEEGGGEAPEPLLAGGVPQLELDPLTPGRATLSLAMISLRSPPGDFLLSEVDPHSADKPAKHRIY